MNCILELDEYATRTNILGGINYMFHGVLLKVCLIEFLWLNETLFLIIYIKTFYNDHFSTPSIVTAPLVLVLLMKD